MNGWGGRRSGAGRKAGGGVTASATKTLRTEARALLAEIVGTKKDPLMVAISIAANPKKPDALRLEAALGAARYLHPALSASAVAHAAPRGDAAAGFLAIMERLAKMAPEPPTLDAAHDVVVPEKAA